jgi:MFS family permease
MALVGKWFVRRLGAAMGIYTVLLSLGFIATTVALGLAVPEVGWRAAWQGMGACLIVGLALPAALVAHSTPESLGLAVEHDPAANQAEGASATLAVALRTPLFWVLALAASLFGLVWSAITLFNEAILAERGFDQRTFVLVMAILVFVGLPANLLTGWAAQRRGATPLVAVGMALLAAALAAFPWVTTLWQVLLYAAALGTAGGMVTVLFFTAFPQAFGRGHLGSIQAVVQVCTVLASALGPVVLTQTKRLSGSYTPFFLATGAAALLLGGIAWWTPRPGGRTRP